MDKKDMAFAAANLASLIGSELMSLGEDVDYDMIYMRLRASRDCLDFIVGAMDNYPAFDDAPEDGGE